MRGRRKCRDKYTRELLFLEFIEGLAFYPQDWGPGFCQGRLPAVLPWAAPHEQRETGGRPLWHLLNEGRWRGECVDALTSPSGGAQQEPTEPAAPKSDFHTSSHHRTRLPLGRRKRSIKQVWPWWLKGVRRPKEAFLEDLALSSNLSRSSQVGKQSLSLNDPMGAKVLLWGGHNQCLRDVWVTDTYFINNLTYTKCPRESLTGWLLTAPDNSRGNWSHAGSAASTYSSEAMVPFPPQGCETNK